MKKSLLQLATCLSVVFCTANVHADSVIAKFFFEKNPPRAGILYATDGEQQKIEQQVIDQKDKEFTQEIYVVSPDTKVTLKNSDTMDHNIFARGNDQVSGFDAGLLSPSQEKDLSLNWSTPAFERLSCKIHPKMRAYMASVPNQSYLTMPFKQEGVSDAYQLTIDDSTTSFGLLLIGYTPIKVSLPKGKTVEVEIKKNDEVRGKMTLTRQ